MSYWQDRLADNQNKLSNKTAKQIEKQMKKYYQSAAQRVIAEFEATYNKILKQQAEGKEVTVASLYKLDSYWQQQAQIRNILQKLGEKQIALLTKEFELNFFDIYYSIALDGSPVFNTLDTATVQQMISGIWVADGKHFSQRVWKNNELLIQTLNEELIHCVATGAKSTQLKQVLQERFNVSFSNADMIARTELAHIQTQAAQKRYEDYGIQEMEVWADEDERRCDICGKLHKQRFPIGATPPIPAHPRCRCCIVPVVNIE
jgi:SPP1 gp7 family putative phage head morphogenesis protein